MNETALLTLIQQTLADLKAKDIVILPVAHLTSLTDHMIIVSGTSNRHVRSIAENIVTTCKHNDFAIHGIEGLDTGEWVLIDLIDVVVHVMLPDSREFYDLERLWSKIDIDDEENSEML